MEYLFYVSRTHNIREDEFGLSNGIYKYDFLKPDYKSFILKKISLIPFGVWWLFDHFKIFSNKDYSLFLIYDNNILIHRSCIFPKYFRFPFMKDNDLQIGDTWTMPEYRGKGLATFAIHQILKSYKQEDRNFWYVVSKSNKASIKVIEKCDFSHVGEGIRTKFLGISILGRFELKNLRNKKLRNKSFYG